MAHHVDLVICVLDAFVECEEEKPGGLYPLDRTAGQGPNSFYTKGMASVTNQFAGRLEPDWCKIILIEHGDSNDPRHINKHGVQKGPVSKGV